MFRNSAVIGLMFASDASQVAMNGDPTGSLPVFPRVRINAHRYKCRTCGVTARFYQVAMNGDPTGSLPVFCRVRINAHRHKCRTYRELKPAREKQA
ncbi:hypothetical protein [Pantoea dispersa]|uniref:Transposase n=1 Tax=Pantoea dispersa TaxID=59814 RepID=A0ABY3A2E4_9GAMM|nr:hypothetical protein [Pantoea dispersa]TQC75215.1 hypothetical protein FK492_12035 [Pantoea dispersa]